MIILLVSLPSAWLEVFSFHGVASPLLSRVFSCNKKLWAIKCFISCSFLHLSSFEMFSSSHRLIIVFFCQLPWFSGFLRHYKTRAPTFTHDIVKPVHILFNLILFISRTSRKFQSVTKPVNTMFFGKNSQPLRTSTGILGFQAGAVVIPELPECA